MQVWHFLRLDNRLFQNLFLVQSLNNQLKDLGHQQLIMPFHKAIYLSSLDLSIQLQIRIFCTWQSGRLKNYFWGSITLGAAAGYRPLNDCSKYFRTTLTYAYEYGM